MTPVIYDGSFEGLHTAIFEIYEYKIAQPKIMRDDAAGGSLFEQPHPVVTDKTKSERVYKKLRQKLTSKTRNEFYKTFLSELPGIEDVLFRFAKYVLDAHDSVECNYGHPDVLMVRQTGRKVHREKHRMEAFVRFELTKDNLYYCIVQPDFNVLPLISNHFEKRYADQRWLIYDSLRKYGIYYDLENVNEITLSFDADLNNPAEKSALVDESEGLYQQLWKTYFSSVNIAARKNMKLHIQHMPKRYWKFLTEKKGTLNT